MFLAEQSANAAVMIETYKSLAASNDWLMLTPEILVGLLSLAALLDGMLLKKKQGWITPAMIKVTLLIIAGITGALALRPADGDIHFFGGLLRQPEWFTDIARIFFLLAAFCATHLSTGYLRTKRLGQSEYLHLLLVATAAMMLLVQANHFVLFFMALETIAVTMYVLVGYDRDSAASLEAGVKYLVTGALSSALLLAGIVLLYGLGGSALNPQAAMQDMLRFDCIAAFVSNHAEDGLVKLGVTLVLGGVAFKIGAFPFNVWIPDVYQGAPTPTTAFLATASKGAGVCALVILTAVTGAPFGMMPETLMKVLIPVTGLTLLFGNIPALGQLNVKRLMGLSGISHAGFLLLGVLAAISTNTDHGHDWARIAILVYLFTYLFSNTLVFFVITKVNGEDDSRGMITDYKGLYRRSPFLAGLFAIGLGSLAGVPPTLGFVAKLLILIAAFKAGLYGLLALAFVCLVMSMYYYLGWMREAFHRVDPSVAREPALIEVGRAPKIILSILALIVLFGFTFQFFV